MGQLTIYDIKNFSTPKLHAMKFVPNAFAVALGYTDNYAFVSVYTRGLDIIDITNPAVPAYISNTKYSDTKDNT